MLTQRYTYGDLILIHTRRHDAHTQAVVINILTQGHETWFRYIHIETWYTHTRETWYTDARMHIWTDAHMDMIDIQTWYIDRRRRGIRTNAEVWYTPRYDAHASSCSAYAHAQLMLRFRRWNVLRNQNCSLFSRVLCNSALLFVRQSVGWSICHTLLFFGFRSLWLYLS